MEVFLFCLTWLLLLTEISANGDAKTCCDVINVKGKYFPNGNYTKMSNTHYDKPVYKHETEGWCIFYARHWKVDGCGFIRPGGDWSQGMGWSQIDSECPGDIGSNWRYYSWDAEGSDSGPVDPGIGINCEPVPSSSLMTKEDGTVLISGAIASVWTELASISNHAIEVSCCSKNNSVTANRKCGNGISCHNICGGSTENNSECLTLSTSSEEADVSETCLDSNGWCHNSSGLQGKRKKRQASCPGCMIAIYNIWYCPGKVTSVSQLSTCPECCLHIAVHRNREVSNNCCELYGLCY